MLRIIVFLKISSFFLYAFAINKVMMIRVFLYKDGFTVAPAALRQSM
jgi:hypothetical protein